MARSSPIGGGTVKQHPNLQARQYKGMILRFNQDIVENDIRIRPSAYLERLVPRKAKNDILFVVEGIKTPLVFARSSETTAPRA